MLIYQICAWLLCVLRLTTVFCALTSFLSCAFAMLSFVTETMLNYSFQGPRRIFIPMVIPFCQLRLIILLVHFYPLTRYVQDANIDLSSHFVRSKGSYRLRSIGISFTRARQVVLDAFSQIGYSPKLFRLHSLRYGDATALASAGVILVTSCSCATGVGDYKKPRKDMSI